MNRYKKFLTLFTLIIIILLPGCTKDKAPIEPLSQTEFMMDTVMTIRIFDKNDKKILDKAYERLEEIENKMSATIESSEVNKINNNAGIEPVQVSPDTYFVLKGAKEHAEISTGAYEPTIGPLVKLWNIQSEDVARDWIPDNKDIEETQLLVDYKNLELLENNMVFLKEKNMRLDLGGIVKGYATDEVRRILHENGVNVAIIDLGGNIYAHGVKEGGLPWNIGVQNPLDATGGHLGVIEIEDQSIVTSGDYERFFEIEGERYHHIIDAKTGYPSNNEITGVTIVADRSIDGDALSTTMFILGVDKGMELAKSMEGIDVVFITKDKSIYLSPGIKDKFKLNEDKNEFTIKEE